MRTRSAEQTKKLIEKKKIQCNKCSFTKNSNLQHHQKVAHEGLRWVCPFCEKDQISKFSHERHLASCKQNVKREEVDADCNSVYLKDKVERTPKAATKIIENLRKKNTKKIKLILELKEQLRRSLRVNIALKKILRYDSRTYAKEKKQLNLLSQLDVR